jgi:steroid 5-alpha reductase family enzyme
VQAHVTNLAVAAVSCAVAALVAAAGSAGSTQFGDGGPATFAVCVAVAFAVNWVAFVPSWLARTERFYDLTGSLTYLSVTVVALIGGNGDARSVALAAMVALWAARLGSFLFARVLRSGGDSRFEQILTDPTRLFMTWTMQGLWVVLTAGAALAAMTAEGPVRDSTVAAVATVAGAVLWVAGLAVEAVADRQKGRFRADPANRGAFITSGLWAWSRHPNYFGEIVLWCGVALVALPALSGLALVTLVSPLFVALLLTRISGIPLLESAARRRWGDDPRWQAYQASTPVLVPRPPKAAAP